MSGVGGVLTIAKQAVSVFPHPLLNRGICIMFIHLYGFWDWRFKPAVLWDANWSRCIGTRSFLSEWVMAATYQSQGRSGGRRAQELTCKTPGTQLCARQPPHPHHPVAAGSVGARLFALIRTCQRCRMQMCVYFIYFYKSYTHIWDLCFYSVGATFSLQFAKLQVSRMQVARGTRGDSVCMALNGFSCGRCFREAESLIYFLFCKYK